MQRVIFGLLLILSPQATVHAQDRVTRDADGYAKWPHANYDGHIHPVYVTDLYPGEHVQWSRSESDDPQMVRQYRMVLEEYDRVHGTHKNPYPPLDREVQQTYPRPVANQVVPDVRYSYRWGWRMRR